MKFDLKRPCDQCPFRKSTAFMFSKSRLLDILEASTFTCHKTANWSDDRTDGVVVRSQVCAGWMILLERERKLPAAMQVAARLGIWKPEDLDMRFEDTFTTIAECFKARSE